MNNQLLQSAICEASEEARIAGLQLMLYVHASPVFGAAKVIEHEVAALVALQKLGVISARPDAYELVMTLKQSAQRFGNN